MESILSNLLLVAWLLPLASFCLILFFGPRLGTAGRGAAYVATGAIVSAFVLSLIALVVWVSNHGIAGGHHPDDHPADRGVAQRQQRTRHCLGHVALKRVARTPGRVFFGRAILMAVARPATIAAWHL